MKLTIKIVLFLLILLFTSQAKAEGRPYYRSMTLTTLGADTRISYCEKMESGYALSKSPFSEISAIHRRLIQYNPSKTRKKPDNNQV